MRVPFYGPTYVQLFALLQNSVASTMCVKIVVVVDGKTQHLIAGMVLVALYQLDKPAVGQGVSLYLFYSGVSAVAAGSLLAPSKE